MSSLNALKNDVKPKLSYSIITHIKEMYVKTTRLASKMNLSVKRHNHTQNKAALTL